MGNWTFRNLVLIWTENVSILKFPTEHQVMKVVILKNIFKLYKPMEDCKYIQ